jgi:uncharacterized protein (DUF305 family)
MEETQQETKNANTTNIILLALVLILGGSAYYFYATGDNHHDHDHGLGEAHHEHHDHEHHMLVESERDFLSGMIPHHQEAVDTSRIILAQGGTTEAIRALAEDIIRVQTEEIDLLKSWYEEWYGEAYTDDGRYEPMMRQLVDLSGAELDRVYLEDMIVHHEGAIIMAEDVVPYIVHDEIRQLVDDITRTQTAEIELMREYLRALDDEQ